MLAGALIVKQKGISPIKDDKRLLVDLLLVWRRGFDALLHVAASNPYQAL